MEVEALLSKMLRGSQAIMPSTTRLSLSSFYKFQTSWSLRTNWPFHTMKVLSTMALNSHSTVFSATFFRAVRSEDWKAAPAASAGSPPAATASGSAQCTPKCPSGGCTTAGSAPAQCSSASRTQTGSRIAKFAARPHPSLIIFIYKGFLLRHCICRP